MRALSLLIGCLIIGGMLSSGAQTAENDAPVYTRADIEAAPEAWRQVSPEDLVLIETSKGRLLIELAPDLAPRHVAQFKAYVQAGLADQTPFHRVIRDFMAQGGDVEAVHGQDKLLAPLEAEFTIRRDPARLTVDPIGRPAEAQQGYYKGMPVETQPAWLAEMSVDAKVETWIPHCPGVLSSARTSDPNSANAQFFLISDEGRHLDRDYTAKGRAIVGLDVIRSIKLGPSPDGYPIANPDLIMKAVLVSDLAEDERPVAFVQRTDTAEWKQRLEAAANSAQDVCDLPSVPAVILD